MIYLMSDLHGYSLNKIKNTFKRIGFSCNDICYVLGDVIDRGDDGIQILEWMMSNPNIKLILGNHESMLLSCDFIFDTSSDSQTDELDREQEELFEQWVHNGAEPTLKALSESDPETVIAIVDYLKDAPLYDTVSLNGKEFLLTHSGLANFSVDKKIEDYLPDELLWNMPKIYDKYYEDIITVFGHTPTYFFGSEYEGKLIVTQTWIDIDTGAAYGRTPMLLRLDDMKRFYIC